MLSCSLNYPLNGPACRVRLICLTYSQGLCIGLLTVVLDVVLMLEQVILDIGQLDNNFCMNQTSHLISLPMLLEVLCAHCT